MTRLTVLCPLSNSPIKHSAVVVGKANQAYRQVDALGCADHSCLNSEHGLAHNHVNIVQDAYDERFGAL